MADTPRTRAELLTLFADNTIGSISPQDLRDFVVTILGGYTSIKTVDGTTAQTGISTAPTLLTQWDTNGISDRLTPDHTTDSITVDIDGVYDIDCFVSFAGSGTTTFEIHLRVDGVEQDEGMHRKIGTGGDVGSAGFGGQVSLTAGQVLTAWIEADGSSKSVTVADGQFKVKQIG
jgi:hypothetical protein